MLEKEKCRFMKSHEWIFEENGKAWVGISDHAQKEMTDVVFFEAPKIGRKVSQNEPVGAIESVKAAFDIYSPVSGEILAINDAVAKDPSVVNQSPHEKGWLFQIKPSDLKETSALMDWAEYQKFLAEKPH